MSTTLETTALTTWLTDRVAEFAMLPAEEIDPSRPFTEYGLDSVYAVQLCAQLHDVHGLEVDPVLTVVHPSVERLSAHLTSLQTPAGSGER